MAYKDKDKQREADRARQKRRRDKVKAKGVTDEGVTQGVTDVIGHTYTPASQARIKAGHKVAKASDPAVQAVWDRRNAQGQPVMTNPISPTGTSKPPSGPGLV